MNYDFFRDFNARKPRTALPVSTYAFLQAFKEKGATVYFRVFNDTKKEDGIRENLSCTLDQTAFEAIEKQFRSYQHQDCGVFFVVNNGGQKVKDIRKITALVLDFDFGKVHSVDENGCVKVIRRNKQEIEDLKDACLEDLDNVALLPSIIVETKNGLHVYWVLDPSAEQDIELFGPLQKALIKFFQQFHHYKDHVDRTIHDLSRVMRLPNYLHQKDPNDRFPVKIIHFTDTRFTMEEIAEAINFHDLRALKETAKPKPATTSPTASRPVQARKQPAQRFGSHEDNIARLCQINLLDYLGVTAEVGQNFECRFHDDKHPSAVIIERNGQFKYFCNSKNCKYNHPKGLSIIDIVMLRDDCDVATAIRTLLDEHNWKPAYVDPAWANGQMKKYDTNIEKVNEIKSGDTKYTSLKRMLRYAGQYMTSIIEVAKGCLVSDKFRYNNDAVFFMSSRFMAKVYHRSLDKVSKYINLHCVLGLLEKIPLDELNEEVRDNAQIYAKKNHGNTVNFFRVPNFTDELLSAAEQKAKTLVESRFTVKAMSRIFIAKVFGEVFANGIFRTQRTKSERIVEIHQQIYDVVIDNIKAKGFCSREAVINSTITYRGRKLSKWTKDLEFRRELPEVLVSHDVVFARPNKNTKQSLGITNSRYVILPASSVA